MQKMYLDTGELSISIIIITVLSGVGIGPDLQLSFHHPPHTVILHGHPVHEGAEDLILDLLDAAMGVKMLTQCHNSCGNNLIDVIVYDPKFSKVLHLQQRGREFREEVRPK